MKNAASLAIIMATAWLAGCKSDPNVQLLERELRWQEDDLYHLDDHVDDLKAKLESCRRENAALRRERGRSSTDYGPGALPDVEPPPIDLGTPIEPSDTLPDAPPFEGPPAIEPMPMPESGAASPGRRVYAGRQVQQAGYAARIEPGSYDVAEITLNQMLTGGHNTDGQPGDEGVMVVVEPRNRNGEIIEVPGEMSVVVLNPAAQGEAARVARWDFSPDEAADHFRRTVLGEGIHLEMPWPNQPPRDRELNLFVRYTTADGRQFEAERKIFVDPPADAPRREWQAAPERRRTAVVRRRSPAKRTAARTAESTRTAERTGGETRWSPRR